MRSFTVEERRARLGARHGLITPLSDVFEVTRALVVLHATDPATVYLSAMARLAEPSIEAVAAALYDDRTVARVLAMRRTLFVVPVPDLPIVERSSTDAVAATERQRLEGFLSDTGIDDPSDWLAAAADETVAALDGDGLPARAITAAVPRLATKIVMGAGTKWAGTAGATSRTLAMLANEGVLMRGRPAGAWTGRQYEWHLRRDWLGDADPDPGSLAMAEASTELVRCWLARFGPATFDDLKWWTGWKVSQLRPALAAIDVAEVDLDGEPGIALADDLDEPEPVGPWVALLPALDPTPMGWKERAWYLGPHKGPLYDRNGNVGPTIWADGRIVGGWGQRPNGEVVTRLLEDVGADHRTMIEDATGRLATLMGDTVVKPSFPTPLQRELAS